MIKYILIYRIISCKRYTTYWFQLVLKHFHIPKYLICILSHVNVIQGKKRLKCFIKVSILVIDKILKMVIMSKHNTDESQNTLFRLMLLLCKQMWVFKTYTYLFKKINIFTFVCFSLNFIVQKMTLNLKLLLNTGTN